MKIEGYGITLVRLTRNDIEFLREKRNLPEVSAYMEYREHISEEAQIQWFNGINNEFNNYFLIEYNGERIGLISGAEIDWDTMVTGNGGLFLWETGYWGTAVPVYASFLLTELSFIMGFKKTYIRTLQDNERAMDFNRSLGYLPEPDQEEVHNKLYSLVPENFDKATGAIRAALRKKNPQIVLELIQPFDPMNARVYEKVKSISPEILEVKLSNGDER